MLKSIKWITGSLLATILMLLVADLIWPLKLPEQDKSFAAVITSNKGKLLRAFADKQGIWRYPIQVEQVSPKYLEALIAYEDRYFYQHPGVNPFSLIRAAYQWIQQGRIISGGSTLTMQVARILHPQQRSITGKIQQILRAFQLEWHLSKTEILTLYLNYAPFGGTFQGVQAASLQYLKKPAAELRYSEAALLAVLPQAPTRLRPDKHPDKAEYARNKVLDRMVQFGIWSEQNVKLAKQEKVAVWQLKAKLNAPLLSRRLHNEYPHQEQIQTTIISGLQQQFSSYVKDYVAPLDKSISAAILLVENKSRKVLVYKGSANFFNNQRFGHVDMITALRSPGSTLKPFLYGMALDANLIHSESLLIDAPRVSSQYRPGNFSQGFSGPVSATKALQRSLNLPFVQLIEAYGSQKFVNQLAHVQQPLKIPDNKANPAVILGGAGITLERLVTLYSSLADSGIVKPLRYTETEQQNKGRRLLSPEAAWITWNSLKGVKKPRGFSYGLSQAKLADIGWKTGTSWDYRDVWAIGVSKQYTLGIWLGKPDGKPMQKTMGSILAGPLLFNLFGQLAAEKGSIQQPENIEQQTICWPDGRSKSLVTKGCDQQRTAYTLQGLTPRTLLSGYLPKQGATAFYNPETKVLIDKKTELRVNESCGRQQTITKTFYFWPGEIEPWLQPAKRRFYLIPPFHPDCKIISQHTGELRIIGIKNGQVYHLVQTETLKLELKIESAAGSFNWYLNGKLMPTHKPELKLELTPDKGKTNKYELLVQDETGVTGRVLFRVL